MAGAVKESMGNLNGQTDFTSDFRKAVIKRVMETGLPSFGHLLSFILTQNWRLVVKGTRESWILRFLFR